MMAESSLSLGYPDLMQAVAEYLNYSTDSDDWTTAQTAELDRIVQSGYRQFLYPPALDNIQAGYEWTFLRPVTTIATVADTEDQDLPDDFGRLIDGFTFGASTIAPPVLADVGEARIRELRQFSDQTGRPRVAAIQIKSSDGTTGQRRKVMWYPTPDQVFTLSYRYEAFNGKLSDSFPYPLGGMKHAEVIRESCLAAAEVFDDTKGVHWNNFMMQLSAAIVRDRREVTKFFGQVGTRYEYDGSYESGYGRTDYTLTVSGNSIQ